MNSSDSIAWGAAPCARLRPLCCSMHCLARSLQHLAHSLRPLERGSQRDDALCNLCPLPLALGFALVPAARLARSRRSGTATTSLARARAMFTPNELVRRPEEPRKLQHICGLPFRVSIVPLRPSPDLGGHGRAAALARQRLGLLGRQRRRASETQFHLALSYHPRNKARNLSSNRSAKQAAGRPDSASLPEIIDNFWRQFEVYERPSDRLLTLTGAPLARASVYKNTVQRRRRERS